MTLERFQHACTSYSGPGMDALPSDVLSYLVLILRTPPSDLLPLLSRVSSTSATAFISSALADTLGDSGCVIPYSEEVLLGLVVIVAGIQERVGQPLDLAPGVDVLARLWTRISLGNQELDPEDYARDLCHTLLGLFKVFVQHHSGGQDESSTPTGVSIEEVEDPVVVEKPVSDEHVRVENVIDEPVNDEHVVIDKHVNDEQVVDEPVVIDEQVIDEPVVIDKHANEPVVIDENVVIDEPVIDEPVANDEPVLDEPVANDEPVAIEKPVANEKPVAKKPVAAKVANEIPQVSEELRVCGYRKCKKPATQLCGQCHKQGYCSRICQAKHWKHHSLACMAS